MAGSFRLSGRYQHVALGTLLSHYLVERSNLPHRCDDCRITSYSTEMLQVQGEFCLRFKERLEHMEQQPQQ